MRWDASPKPNVGDSRIVRKFLLFPRRLDTDQWRWLEYSNILETYSRFYDGDNVWERWEEIKFSDGE